MRILLDADTLLEFVLNRSVFVDKVEDLSKIIQFDGIEVCISYHKKVIDSIKSFDGSRKPKEFNLQMKKLIRKLKIKRLKVTEPIARQARLSPIRDYESAVEICVAIKEGIGAIVTHKPNDFPGELLNVFTLSELQQRKSLEDKCLKEISNHTFILSINPEKISNLNNLFYNIPSYKVIKSSGRFDKTPNKSISDIVIADGIAFEKSLAFKSPLPVLAESSNRINQAYNLIAGGIAFEKSLAFKSPLPVLVESLNQINQAYSLIAGGIAFEKSLPNRSPLANVAESLKSPLAGLENIANLSRMKQFHTDQQLLEPSSIWNRYKTNLAIADMTATSKLSTSEKTFADITRSLSRINLSIAKNLS
jgi:hypothetical protein